MRFNQFVPPPNPVPTPGDVVNIKPDARPADASNRDIWIVVWTGEAANRNSSQIYVLPSYGGDAPHRPAFAVRPTDLLPLTPAQEAYLR